MVGGLTGGKGAGVGGGARADLRRVELTSGPLGRFDVFDMEIEGAGAMGRGAGWTGVAFGTVSQGPK